MDFIINKIEVLDSVNLSFARGEILQKGYVNYKIIDLGTYNMASGVWVLLENDGDQIKLEFRMIPYIVHRKLP